MPFRRAHEIVGAMVRKLLAEGRDFSSLTLKEWKEASDFFGDDAPQAATSLESVYAKRTPQSTHPDAVHAAVRECRAWIDSVANPKAQIPNPKSQR
jgi:argininosuccinate lyase